MRANFRQALVDLAVKIGREIRDSEPYHLSYGSALDLLATVEDSLYALADITPEEVTVSSTLSGSPGGYLPSRHPRRRTEDWQRTSNPIPPAGFAIRCTGCGRCAIDKHLPWNALRQTSQTEDFVS